MIQAVLLTNNQVVISQAIPKVDEDTSTPYFQLMYPYLFTVDVNTKYGFKLTPWLSNVTDSREQFIVYPDKIITLKDPKPEIVEYYKKLVLFNDEKVINEEEEIIEKEPELVKVIPNKKNEEEFALDSNNLINVGIQNTDIDEVYEEGED